MKIGVLAVQGAFVEHERILTELGAQCVELRKGSDLEQEFDGLVLPGGESTVQGKLLKELSMFEELRTRIIQGLPVLATCAGLILLANTLENSSECWFGTLPITVRRNAYGRQLGSFSIQGTILGIPNQELEFPMRFIRAPYITTIGKSSDVQYMDAHGVVAMSASSNDKAEPIAEITKMPDGKEGQNIVGVRYQNQIGLAFHPELTKDSRCHQFFLSLCNDGRKF